MKKNAKQTLADLKSQATSSEDLMRQLAQWDENGEMPEETKRQILGGALAIGTYPGLEPELQGIIWNPPTNVSTM